MTIGIPMKPIPVRSNTVVDLIEVSPSLPKGLIVDSVSRTIQGLYEGTLDGCYCYSIRIRSSYGSVSDSFCLYYTSRHAVYV